MRCKYSLLSLSYIFRVYLNGSLYVYRYFFISYVIIYLFIYFFGFVDPHPTPQIFGTTVQIRSMFVYRLACQLAKISDAFRSYLNVFDDEVGKYFELNSVTVCISISENSIVDSTYQTPIW